MNYPQIDGAKVSTNRPIQDIRDRLSQLHSRLTLCRVRVEAAVDIIHGSEPSGAAEEVREPFEESIAGIIERVSAEIERLETSVSRL